MICGNKNGMYLVQFDADSIYRLLYKGCFGCLTDSVSDIKLKQVLKKHTISRGHSTGCMTRGHSRTPHVSSL